MILTALCAVCGAREVYCTLLEFGNKAISNHANILFDFGEDRCVSLLDESGSEIKFYSYVEALNYMSNHGWRLLSTFTRDTEVGNNAVNVLHCILAKDIAEGLNIKDGLRTTPAKDKHKEAAERQQAKEKRNSDKTIDDAYKY